MRYNLDMSSRKYHSSLAQAYGHKAQEHVALTQAHVQNGNMEAARRHAALINENTHQKMWHESAARLSYNPYDDFTDDEYEAGPRNPYQNALNIQPGAGWSRYQEAEGTPRPY